MKTFERLTLLASVGLLALASAPAMAASFVNGGFESGTFSGWTTGSGYRGNEDNTQINPGQFVPGGSLYDPSLNHSAVIGKSYVDPNVGSLIGSTVYSGNYSARVEDTTYGGYASTVQQQVNNYTDSSIFFAYKAVLDGAHGPDEAATMQVLLTDVTTGSVLVNQMYNASTSGGGGGGGFVFDSSSGAYYTPTWQIIQLNTPIIGHDYLLQVLGSDCEPTGHYGYVYLDGFGSVLPPSTVPLPASLPMFGLSILTLGGTAGLLRRRRNAGRAA